MTKRLPLSRSSDLGFPGAVGIVLRRALRFDVVGGRAAPVHRAAHEIEYEARVIVVQEGVGILDAGARRGGVDQRFGFANRFSDSSFGVRVRPRPSSQYSQVLARMTQG